MPAGRPSKLTLQQWDEIGRRLADGEQAIDLAREYGVDRSALTRRFSQQQSKIKTLVSQIVEFPNSQQRVIFTLTERENARRNNLAIMAHEGTALGARMLTLARAKADKATVKTVADDLRDTAAMVAVGNQAAVVGREREARVPVAPLEPSIPDNSEAKAKILQRLAKK